jgi:hypothetical protein
VPDSNNALPNRVPLLKCSVHWDHQDLILPGISISTDERLDRIADRTRVQRAQASQRTRRAAPLLRLEHEHAVQQLGEGVPLLRGAAGRDRVGAERGTAAVRFRRVSGGVRCVRRVRRLWRGAARAARAAAACGACGGGVRRVRRGRRRACGEASREASATSPRSGLSGR